MILTPLLHRVFFKDLAVGLIAWVAIRVALRLFVITGKAAAQGTGHRDRMRRGITAFVRSCAEQREHLRRSFEQSLLEREEPGLRPAVAGQRREPHLPVEPRHVGRGEPRPAVQLRSS